MRYYQTIQDGFSVSSTTYYNQTTATLKNIKAGKYLAHFGCFCDIATTTSGLVNVKSNGSNITLWATNNEILGVETKTPGQILTSSSYYQLKALGKTGYISLAKKNCAITVQAAYNFSSSSSGTIGYCIQFDLIYPHTTNVVT